ncbi:MAG TPA: PAS domain-containing protein [Ignavibacteriaceae bacterium]|nr:PAS domain-containing protein [Ignavibacteriaceae bacterium]
MQTTYNLDFRLFDSFPDMCFILDNKGYVEDLNISARIKLDIKWRGEKNHNILDLIDDIWKESTLSEIEKCKKEYKSKITESKISSGKNIFDVELLIAPYTYQLNNGNSEYFIILARDITESRKKELDLLRFYNIAEKTVFPLQITNIEGKMLYVNAAYETVSGYSREELLGKNPNVFSSKKHSKSFWTNMWTTIKSGKVWVGEVENTKKDGSPFFTQLLISPILNSKGKVFGFFGVHRDLSEKKFLEKQLVHSQKMESIGTLAAGIAHEVGNPLASISAIVQVVQRTTEDSFVKEKIELIKSQVTRISKIIRDLVDFSRPSNYELRLTDINHNINEAVNITRVGAKAKDVDFDFKKNENIPLIPLVADQIEQVFINILLNAVDSFAEPNVKDKKEMKISISTELKDDFVNITFTDNGSGIKNENLIKIFEPFFTTKKEGKGTGLGLWVSYGIVKSFQGDIIVKSKLGEGTTFIISLPTNPK